MQKVVSNRYKRELPTVRDGNDYNSGYNRIDKWIETKVGYNVSNVTIRMR